MSNFREFFEDDNGRLSMARLLVFGVFVITSIQLFRLKDDTQIVTLSSTMLTALVVNYGIAKTNETAKYLKPPTQGDDHD